MFSSISSLKSIVLFSVITVLLSSSLCNAHETSSANVTYDDEKSRNNTFAAASSVAAATSSLAQSLSTPAKISATLSSLGKVLNRMFDQIEADERVYQEFKQELLQQEVNSVNVDLSWPAIKDLVSAEVKAGRANMEAQVAQFKIEVLDMVQKGLDALRADLRATVMTGFAPKETSKTTVNLDVIADAAPVASNNNRSNSVMPSQLSDFVDSLDCSDNCKQDIRNFIQQKMQQQDDYGQSPFDALREMQNALQGRLSSRDVRAELYQRLEELTRDYLRNPSPVAKQALESLRSVMIAALNTTGNATSSSEPVYNATNTASDLPRHVPDYPTTNNYSFKMVNQENVASEAALPSNDNNDNDLIANIYAPAQTEAAIVTVPPPLSKLEQIKQQLEELEQTHNS